MAGARLPVRPCDDPVRPRFGREVGLAGRDPAAHRNSRLVHSVGGTRNQRVPVEQVPSFSDQPVGAGHGKPAQLAYRLRRQFHAVGDPPVAPRIVEAMAGLGVQ